MDILKIKVKRGSIERPIGLFKSGLLLARISALRKTYDLNLFNLERKPIWVNKREDTIKRKKRYKINTNSHHNFILNKNKKFEDLQKHYERKLNNLLDKVSTFDCRISPEMENIYKYGHAK